MPFKDECGVFGVYNISDAAKLCYLGLYALQHRGQESAGIVTRNHRDFYVMKSQGLVSEIFNHDNLAALKGRHAVGHVRYSTTGSDNIHNIQPLYSKTAFGTLALAHNGNLTNAYMLYKELKSQGSLFQSTIDSEVILHLLSKSSSKNLIEGMLQTLEQIQGAYSLVCLTDHGLMAVRDPYGFRPLVLGKLGDGYVVSSETCALDLIGASYVREVLPGELIVISKEGLKSFFLTPVQKTAFCIFEHVYFARPDSVVFGETVHQVRKAFGHQLAKEHPVKADLVMAIPDSGISAALGYAEKSGIPYEVGMTRNHYVGRTFIQPSQKIRDFGVKVKLNPIQEVLKNKRVIVIDDSLVRGTTSKRRIQAIRDAGAKEIHLRISSPPIKFPCHFGIDTPKQSKLIAFQKHVKDIMTYVGADSLGYLSEEGMLAVMKKHPSSAFCTACFTGKYPFLVHNKGKHKFESGGKIKLFSGKK